MKGTGKQPQNGVGRMSMPPQQKVEALEQSLLLLFASIQQEGDGFTPSDAEQLVGSVHGG